MNRCYRCGEPLTDENWYPSIKKIKRYICKQCHNKKVSKWAKENIPDPEKEEYNCGVCGVKLSTSNWYKSSRKKHWVVCKTCLKKKGRNYYYNNPKIMRDWKRRSKQWYYDHVVGTIKNGKRVYIRVKKKPKPDKCELCKTPKSYLQYHHWNDEVPEFGMWLCVRCHLFVNYLDEGYLERKMPEKYFRLRNQIEREGKKERELLVKASGVC